MKIRLNLVSNSSSASFVIPLDVLSITQYNKILNYSENNSDKDGWRIGEIESPTSKTTYLIGSTIMDNGDMGEFLENIGIDSIYVQGN